MKRIPIEKYREKLKKIIGKCKHYQSFIGNKEKAYEYSKVFDIKICPYCNINYIYTVITKKVNLLSELILIILYVVIKEMNYLLITLFLAVQYVIQD